METKQIYQIVNSINSQGAAISPITVTDTQSFVSLGNDVLSSNTNVESFFNRLIQLVGLHIHAFRSYESTLKNLYKNDFEWGAIVQKTRAKMPDAVEDPSYDLQNGTSVDPFKVYKPEVLQKLFVKRTPYMIPLTRAYEQLKEAFRNEASFESFWAMCAGELKNRKTITLENLGRATICNFIAECQGTDREYPLVTMFNTEMGLTGADALDATTAKHSDLFLNYMIGQINYHADFMRNMTTRFNDGSKESFTPDSKRVVRVLAEMDSRAKTVTQYAAFHDKYVSIDGGYDTIAFWQSAKKGEESQIKVKRASDGANKTINNVVAMVHDIDALGLYQEKAWTLSSGWNGAGSYITEFHHHSELWFNDLSENGIYFTLN